MFHRLNVPTYHGGLPIGFDYLNNPALSGGAGVPVAMDGKKAGGPNDGTYGVAFGEDATSNFANRGIKALGENTDVLDDILRRDIAVTARTGDVTAVAPVFSVIFVAGQGDVFVGAFGVPNNQATRDSLISVLDDNDEEILNGSTKVMVSSIVDNNLLLTNLVGTQASGFYNAPTVNFNTPIPAGVTYRLYYGERSNLASLPLDALTNIKIRGAQEVTADVERTLRDLHALSSAQAWDGPWDATIKALASAGLNGVYRRTTAETDTSPYDVPGSGAVIFRDGPALTVSARNIDWQNNGIGALTPFPDPILACYRVTRDSFAVGAGYDLAHGGDVGLYQDVPYHNTLDFNEGANAYVAGPTVLETVTRSILAATLSGANVVSRITPSTLASLNPDAGATDLARSTVQVGAGDYIWDLSHNQSIRYTDLIEVTDATSGEVIGTYHIKNFPSRFRIELIAPSGVTPRLGPSGASYNVRLRWIQPTISIGGNLRAAMNDSGMHLPNFAICAPSHLTDSPTTERYALNVAFLAANRNYGATPLAAGTSLAWGGFDLVTGLWGIGGRLFGDGSLTVAAGVQRLNLLSVRPVTYLVSNGGRAITWNPTLQGGTIIISSDGPLIGAAPCSFAIDTSSGFAPTAGDEFSIFIKLDVTSTGPMTMTWPADFHFSGTDGTIPAANNPPGPGSSIMTQYIFKYVVTSTLTGWFATRTDF